MQRTLFLLSALAFGAVSAFAVDGQVLINQSTLTAAGGTYIISQPGSYKLSGNLVASGASAISITASYVTLDLNGFTISGPASVANAIFPEPTTGVFISGNFVTVRNGAIFGFNSQIDVLLGAGITGTYVQDLTLYSGSPYAGQTILYFGAGARILNITTDTGIAGTCPMVVANSVAAFVNAEVGAALVSSAPGCNFYGNGTVR